MRDNDKFRLDLILFILFWKQLYTKMIQYLEKNYRIIKIKKQNKKDLFIADIQNNYLD